MFTFRVLPELTVPSWISMALAFHRWTSVGPGQRGACPLPSPSPPICRKQKGEAHGRVWSPSKPPPTPTPLCWAECTEPGTRNVLQAPPDIPGVCFLVRMARWEGRLFNWMMTTTWKSKMLPSPLKYSRCPPKDVKTRHKPPINFYGGLRSTLRIITFIFTRQGTKTTGEGGEAPGQCSLTQRSRLTASFSLHLRPTERELVAS